MNGFTPSPGRIEAVRFPSGPGIRVDTALQPGDEVSLHYDALVAKLVAWGPSRKEAIARMVRALHEFQIVGIRTTIPFHRLVVSGADFGAGRIDTGYVDRRFPAIRADLETIGPHADQAAILAAIVAADEDARASRPSAGAPISPWALSGRRAMMAGRTTRITRI